MKGLEKMVLLQKGSRLSVQPVTAHEWEIICRVAGSRARDDRQSRARSQIPLSTPTTATAPRTTSCGTRSAARAPM